MLFRGSLISKRPYPSIHLSIQRWSKYYYNAYISKAGTDVVWLLRFFLLLIFIIIIVPALTARGRGTEGNTVVVSYRERITRKEGRWALYGIHKVSPPYNFKFPPPSPNFADSATCIVLYNTKYFRIQSDLKQININKLRFY